MGHAAPVGVTEDRVEFKEGGGVIGWARGVLVEVVVAAGVGEGEVERGGRNEFELLGYATGFEVEGSGVACL